MVLAVFAVADMRICYTLISESIIDVYTQKEPYSGKGQNVGSDAFGPEENVILYALVTCNNGPCQNLPVLFNVTTPSGASFVLTAQANSSGIARVDFAVVTPPVGVNESDVFGDWLVRASAQVGDISLQDALTFKVDFVVKLLSVRPIDGNLSYQTYFGKGGHIGLEIALRNIAMTVKSATIAITLKDELGVPVNFTQIEAFDVPPDERLILVYFRLLIPAYAYTGYATVSVSALASRESHEVPYCPGISASFYITSNDPVTLAFHDAALADIVPSAVSVEVGQPLNVNIVVRNEGTETESFSVEGYLGNVLIGTKEVVGLLPYSKSILDFIVDTAAFNFGNYTLSAVASGLANEADLSDNAFTDGVVEIGPHVPKAIHDIAVTDVGPSSFSVYVGDNVQIFVNVANKGTETESFNVSAKYGQVTIAARQVDALSPNASTAIVFDWNTSSVGEGQYQLSAVAALPEDVDVLDNTFVNGFVQITARPPPVIHDIAILNVNSSRTMMYIGDVDVIEVLVKNQGDYAESFNVTLLYDSSVIGVAFVDNLAPGSTRSLAFFWNTQGLAEGKYTLTANASQVPSEDNIGDNIYVDGSVEVKAGPPPPLLVHDIEVLHVVPSGSTVYVGEIIEVKVTVRNKGNATESFDVSLRYDQSAAGTSSIHDLPEGAQQTLTFRWNTTGVPNGNYRMSAYADPVQGEENTVDNGYVDGYVQLVSPEAGFFGFDWFYLFLLLLLIVLTVIFILLSCLKRNRKESRKVFASGWTAWFYGYDSKDTSRSESKTRGRPRRQRRSDA